MASEGEEALFEAVCESFCAEFVDEALVVDVAFDVPRCYFEIIVVCHYEFIRRRSCFYLFAGRGLLSFAWSSCSVLFDDVEVIVICRTQSLYICNLGVTVIMGVLLTILIKWTSMMKRSIWF